MIYRLTENVYTQDNEGPADALITWDSLKSPPAADPAKLAHAIHFYKGDSASLRVQELTVNSTLEARRCAVPDVKLLSVVMQSEADLRYGGFVQTAPMTRTVADFHQFMVPRPLPLLFDIVDSAAAAADADGWLILTNNDICLTAGFYGAVRKILAHGIDCLIIHRMTASGLDTFGSMVDVAGMEVGEKHPGMDCFIFPTSWASQFTKVPSCVGMRAVMRPLLYNLAARAERMLIMRRACLTWHYGNDIPWSNNRYNDYKQWNSQMMLQSLQQLSQIGPDYARKIGNFCTAHNEDFKPGPPK